MLTKHRKVRAILNSVIALALMLTALLTAMGSASAGSLPQVEEHSFAGPKIPNITQNKCKGILPWIIESIYKKSENSCSPPENAKEHCQEKLEECLGSPIESKRGGLYKHSRCFDCHGICISRGWWPDKDNNGQTCKY